MSMVRTVVQKPITVVIFCVTLILIAFMVIPLINQNLTPDIEFPFISVITTYEGASPLEIESSVTKILEPSLVNVQGLKTMSSVSQEGTSQITLQFDWGVNLESATNDVRDQIDRVRGLLPDDSDAPTIFKLDINSAIPVSGWSFSGNGLDADELYTIADRDVLPYLEQVLGVSEAELSGGRERQVRVELIQNRLEAYKISIGTVKQALLNANYQLAGGNIDEGVRRLSLRVDGKFKTIEEIQNIVITTLTQEGNAVPISIRLRDLGNVFIGYADPTVTTYINGEKGLSIRIRKQSDANTVKVAEGVEKQIKRLYRQLPEGLKFEKLFDTADDIRNSLAQVMESIITGAFLTIITLLFFLRNVKSALIVAITMPLSIMTTIMCMYFFNLSLNVISLAGLNLGVGMIVDSSIVLLENTTRYREKGVMARSAAILGCEEMVGAIMSGSLTTICVFLPVVLFNKELGIVGAIFNDLAFTIVISLGTSLIFAIVTVPVLAGVLLPIRTTAQRPLKGFMKLVDKKVVLWLDYLDTKYASGIAWALQHKKPIVYSVAISLFISLWLLANAVGFELMPPSDDSAVMVSYKFPPGTRLEVNTETMNTAANEIKRRGGDGIQHTMLVAGAARMSQENEAEGTLYIIAPASYDDRTLSSTQLKDLIRSVLNKIPGLEFNFSANGPGGSGGPEVTLKISSNDEQALTKTTNDVLELMKTIPALTEVQTNLDASLPEIRVAVDRNKASEYGLSFRSIATEIRDNIEGGLSGTFEYKGDDIDIWTVLREEDRSSMLDLDKIFLKSPGNLLIPLASIARLEKGESLPQINRENQRRENEVTAYAATGPNGKPIAASEANKQAFAAIAANIVLPEGVLINMGGDAEDLAELAPKILMVFFLAVFLVYAVMASQFENLKDPFIIITSILTTPIGPSLLYVLSGTPMSSYSMIGFIVLAGIVVNHGIVLVDYTNLLRKRGMPLQDAVILAGRHRLRPILMTTLTTILGMIPMAVSTGDGTTMTRPIGQTVFAGMLSASLLTLLFTPVLYYIFNKKNEAKKIAMEKAKRAQLEADLAKARN